MVNETRKGGVTVGYRIKERRIEMGMSQVELSEKANVSRTIISGLENGTIKVTTTETLLKLANALNSKISDIFLN
ncbi:XRE family transcriptional regulator [Blautia sp. OF01-4LB]|jgi:transcriptional regulator with XRE-family HTH domain|nr:helix-turn-helix transcriptional regulator [Blautia sp. C3-R-101]RHP80404.1 XRE family transcriptional regulator [Blautia sp. OF01-4LB]